MAQMVLTSGSTLPSDQPSRIPTVAEKPPLAIRIANGAACACGVLIALHFWIAAGATGLAVISLFTIASLAHAWFQSRRKARLAAQPAAVAAAIPSNQGGLS